MTTAELEATEKYGGMEAGVAAEGIVAAEDAEKGCHVDTDTPTEYVTGIKLGLIVASVALACFLCLLDISVIATAVPKITDEFQSLIDVGWYGGAYNLGSAALQPLSGKVYNHFPLKWSFLGFFTAFEVGSAVCGAAHSSVMLIIGRTVAGLGAAGIINGAMTIVSASTPLERRPPLIGTVMGVAQLGQIVGPLIGGAFTTGYTWRWSFYINLPLGALVALPIVLIHIPEQCPKKPPTTVLARIHHHLDFVGFALFAPAVVQLLLALQFGGNQYPWNSATIIGLFCGAGGTALVWLAWNYYKKDDALIPVSIVRKPVVYFSSLNYTFLFSLVFGGAFFVPIYFQAIKQVSALLSGVYLMPNIGPQLVATVLTGTIVGKVGRVPPLALLAALLASVGTGLYGLFQPDTPAGMWAGFQVISGLGQGIGFQMPVIAVQNNVEMTQLAEAMAFLVFAQFLGPTIFLVIYQTIFTTGLKAEIPKFAPTTSVEAVISAGATHFRDVVPADELPGVLVGYSNAIDRVFYLSAGVGVLSFLAAFGMGWKDIRPKKAAAGAGDEAGDGAAATDASAGAAAGVGAVSASSTAAASAEEVVEVARKADDYSAPTN